MSTESRPLHLVRLDWLITATFFLAALAIRLPYLNSIPSFSDEGMEVLWGLDIALGKHLPLNGYPPHYGPLFAYLIALLFRIFGTSIVLPRSLIVVFGAATVSATYVLARLMRDRTTALIAAGLVLTNPLSVILASHQGWSSGMTPLLTTVTGLALYVGVAARKSIYLALSGLLAGLTLQAHPTTAAALVGMLLWFLLRRDIFERLKQPAPYIALALFLFGYSPMIVANAHGDSPLLQAAYDHSYVFAPTLDPAEYLNRTLTLFKVFGYFVGEGFGDPSFILRTQAIAIESLLIGAVVWALYRRRWFVPLPLSAMFFILPVVAIPQGYRYSMNLIPFAYVLIAIFLVAIFQALALRLRFTHYLRVARWTAISVTLIFIASPLITIANSYRDALALGWTNEGYFALAQIARASTACGGRLFVEQRDLDWAADKNGAEYFVLNNVDYVLTLDGCSHGFTDYHTIVNQVASTQDAWVITPRKNMEALPLTLVSESAMPHSDETHVPIFLYHIVHTP